MERSGQRVIHAYCHVRTHQVLYSFTPYLHNASVARQFPDTGANTSFTHLRKDLWRPLWTLSIPAGENADAQGRHVFKKLREWRKLHETSWEPPAMLALNHSPKEIERMQEELDQRGGSKKENVYDVIKHQKKKMRVNAVLDQRANSVADLAAVLASQEALGAQTQQNKDAEAKGRRNYQIKTMLELAQEAEQGGLAKIESRIAELGEMKANADRLGEPMELSNSKIKRELKELHAQKNKMQFSTRVVAEATEKLGQAANTLSPADKQTRIGELLPSFPTPNASIPKRGALRARLQRANAPVFSTEGIVVKWANQLDAEYAESWPETIAHQAMGLLRHRAPRADEEAVMDVATLRSNRIQKFAEGRQEKERLAEKPGFGKTPEGKSINKVRIDVLSKVKEAVAARGTKRHRLLKQTA